MKTSKVLVLTATAALVFAACGGAASQAPTTAPTQGPPASQGASAPPATTAPEAATVRLQLQWAPQAQFAGYFAADRQGYFTAENLTVQILPGGPDVIPQAVGSAPDGPEFTISWVPKVLQARESGSDLVDIAQIFQRSGTLSVSWKATGITGPGDFKGKKIGVWDFGNEFEVTAGALAQGLVAGTDYTKVIQPFDMSLLINKQIDVAEAMIYNEYAQLLETTNPETGALYSADDLNVIDWNDQRVAMLQDAIFARGSWLKEGTNRDVAVRFVRASVKGWIYCRDHPADCAQYTTDAGSALGAGHQAWMMNEVNALIWPSPDGVGVLDPIFYSQTVKVSKQTGVLTKDPSVEAYDSTIAQEAIAGLTDDLKGTDFKKGVVAITPGGE
ncbi:MAG: ABC transporter substrate-binding protein [Chloroflexota bacterium]